MPRTTVDIEEPVLQELKTLGQQQGRPLGKLISELVVEALAHRAVDGAAARPRLAWISKPMRSTIDWADKEALVAVLDEDDRAKLSQEARPGGSGRK